MKTELPAIELGFREGASDKVYRAAIEDAAGGFVVNFAYGRRGSTLNADTKTPQPVPYQEAVVIYEKLVKSKVAKGYKPVSPLGGNGIGMNLAEQRDTDLRAQLLNPITEDEAKGYLTDDLWCAQEKFDGKRMLLRKSGASVVAANRLGLSIEFPDVLASQLAKLPDLVIDGECVGERFYAFDLLENGADLRQAPYRERLQSLESLFKSGKNPIIPIVSIVVAETALGKNKSKLLAKLKANGKEGVVFKKLDAKWSVGRPASGGNALKCKFWSSCSCVVSKVNGRRSVEIALGGTSVGNVTIPPNHVVPKTGQVVEIRYLYVRGSGVRSTSPSIWGHGMMCRQRTVRLRFRS